MIIVGTSIVVPVLIYIYLPRALKHFGYKPAKFKKVLAAACLLYFVSWYLPTFHIEGENTAFVTHFVGGGIFTGLLWFYLKQTIGWKANLLLELVTLYFLVSGLGVANELFELFLDETGLVDFVTGDTWWDLLANTSGALLFWFIYKFGLDHD